MLLFAFNQIIALVDVVIGAFVWSEKKANSACLSRCLKDTFELAVLPRLVPNLPEC